MAPSPGAWLYVIARNRARSLLEPRRTPELVYVASLDDQPAPAGPTAPDEHAIANSGALAADVERCMETLSDQQRAVLRADLAHGGIAPAGLPAAEVNRLHGVWRRTLESGEGRDALIAQGYQLMLLAPDASARFFKSEIDRMAKIVKTANVKLD